MSEACGLCREATDVTSTSKRQLSIFCTSLAGMYFRQKKEEAFEWFSL